MSRYTGSLGFGHTLANTGIPVCRVSSTHLREPVFRPDGFNGLRYVKKSSLKIERWSHFSPYVNFICPYLTIGLWDLFPVLLECTTYIYSTPISYTPVHFLMAAALCLEVQHALHAMSITSCFNTCYLDHSPSSMCTHKVMLR